MTVKSCFFKMFVSRELNNELQRAAPPSGKRTVRARRKVRQQNTAKCAAAIASHLIAKHSTMI